MESARYQQLRAFLTRQMRMNHIYQPAMLLELLRRNGEATVRQLAETFLARDISQIEYYEEITNRMPGRVLTSHRITKKHKVSHRRSENKYFLLGFEELSLDEIDSLARLCEEAVSDYITTHKKGIWSHRNRTAKYISGSLRYRILTKGKMRCALCFETEKPLDIDHIVPRKHGGPDDESNLQVLCYTCNRSKGATDDTSFVEEVESYKERHSSCAFCNLTTADEIDSNILAVAIRD